MPPRSRRAGKAPAGLPSDGDSFWEPAPPTRRARVCGFLRRLLRRALRLLMWLVVAATLCSIAYDEAALRGARRSLAASEARAAAEDVAGARDAFNDAFERFQWSEVRDGSPASRSAVAAAARLLRLPVVAVRQHPWRDIEAALKERAAALRALSAERRPDATAV